MGKVYLCICMLNKLLSESEFEKGLVSVFMYLYIYIDGLMQGCSNSISNALELLQFCTKQSISCAYDAIEYILSSAYSLSFVMSLWCCHITLASRCLTSPVIRVFAQKLIQASMKETIKALHYWHFDWWIPPPRVTDKESIFMLLRFHDTVTYMMVLHTAWHW